MEISKQDVMNCMFSEWYPKFSHLTMKSYIIKLPDEFVKYLQDNGTIILPKGASLKIRAERSSDDDEDWSDEEDESTEEGVVDYPEVIKAIKETLEKLNHKAFPKLNWSAPKDAVWITANNNLRCSTPGDVILLLKSSDFITYDLTSPFKLCRNDSDPVPAYDKQLVLRKWANLVPGMEFRCFVRNHQLIAISQRYHQQYYDYIEKSKESLPIEIFTFFKENIKDKFSSRNYIVDVYKKRDGNFWIIDFNPWGLMNDPLLFTWEELEDFDVSRLSHDDCPILSPDGETVGIFRYTSRNVTMQPSEVLSHRVPQDFLDLSRGEDATKLVDFLRMKIQSEDQQESSDDEEAWQLPSTS